MFMLLLHIHKSVCAYPTHVPYFIFTSVQYVPKFGVHHSKYALAMMHTSQQVRSNALVKWSLSKCIQHSGAVKLNVEIRCFTVYLSDRVNCKCIDNNTHQINCVCFRVYLYLISLDLNSPVSLLRACINLFVR